MPIRSIVVVALVAACGVDEVEVTTSVEQAGNTYQSITYQGNTYQGNTYQSAQAGVQSVSKSSVKKQNADGTWSTLSGVILQSTQLSGTINGVTYTDAQLVGFRMTGTTGLGGTVSLKIDGYTTDVPPLGSGSWNLRGQSNSEIRLYKVSYRDSDGLWKALCPSRLGKGGSPYWDSNMALFLPGYWATSTGQYVGTGSLFTVACWSGTIAKCARWGYKPWQGSVVAPNGETANMQNLHLACARGALADYCGSGESHTHNNTHVDVFDRYGFVTKESENSPYPFAFAQESSFGVDNAGCVERSRWEEMGASCPIVFDVEPDPSGPLHAPLTRTVSSFRSGERDACADVRPSELIYFDSSTYCAHSTSSTGDALSADCNTCTAAVCASSTFGYCCDSTDPRGWDDDCAIHAALVACAPGGGTTL